MRHGWGASVANRGQHSCAHRAADCPSGTHTAVSRDYEKGVSRPPWYAYASDGASGHRQPAVRTERRSGLRKVVVRRRAARLRAARRGTRARGAMHNYGGAEQRVTLGQLPTVTESSATSPHAGCSQSTQRASRRCPVRVNILTSGDGAGELTDRAGGASQICQEYPPKFRAQWESNSKTTAS